MSVKNAVKDMEKAIEKMKAAIPSDVDIFCTRLFEIRQVVHNLHLSTLSYAEHMALGSFYEELTGLADTFIETYQGQFGLVSIETFNIPALPNMPKLPVDILVGFAEYVVNSKSLFPSHLQNIIEEILSLTWQTVYKLRFLK